MPRCTLPGFVALTALLGAAPGHAQRPDSATSGGARSVGSGVFTTDQAERGKQTHRANCTSCHDATAYTGDAFLQGWLDHTVFDVFEKLRTTMPNDNPGRLSRSEYLDVVAYILSMNGYPAGERELPDDEGALKAVRIDLRPPGKTGGDLLRPGTAAPLTRGRR